LFISPVNILKIDIIKGSIVEIFVLEIKFKVIAISIWVSISTNELLLISRNLFFSKSDFREAPSAILEPTEIAALFNCELKMYFSSDGNLVVRW